MPGINNLRKSFEKPSKEQCSVPFWIWNEKIGKEELLRQEREMQHKGISGLVIHSREGLEIDF